MASSPASFSPPGSPLPLTPADSASSLSSIGKSRFGCTICRQQHLKCDRVLPVCGRCRVGGKRCTLPEMKIRNNCEDAKGKTKFVFPSGQTWAVVPDNLNFYNITGMVERDEPLEDENYVRAHADKIEDEPMSSVDTPTAVNTPLSAATPSASQSASVFSQPTSVFSQPTSVSQPLSLSIQDMLTSSDSISAPPSPLYQVKSPTDRLLSMSPDSVTNCDSIPICINFPLLANSVEAVVWRHYIKHLANWLDMCDPKRSFEKIIPKMAMGSTVLRDAIFALSARHLAHLTRNTNERYSKALKTRAFLYHDQCCKALCHYIGFESLKTEPCFGAAIILRVVEEIEATRLELDKAIHLGGIRAFAGQYAERQVEGQVNDYMGGIRAFVKEFATNQRNDLGKGSLCAALYWVGLRQEIYSAVMHKRAASGFPTEIPLVKDLESRKSLEDDYDWANLAVVHCAKVLNYCYQYEEEGQAGPVDPEKRWQELREMSAFWWAEKPFRPSIVDAADTGSFPETMYNSNCEAIGLQHFLLATLFLEENQPRVVASGGKLTQDRVERVVREICGIGLMHQDSAPCMFTACMAISAFGDRFTELRDQQAMVRILEQTEAEHARPTYQVQGKLRRAWEWEE